MLDAKSTEKDILMEIFKQLKYSKTNTPLSDVIIGTLVSMNNNIRDISASIGLLSKNIEKLNEKLSGKI